LLPSPLQFCYPVPVAIPSYVLQAIEEILVSGYGEITVKVHQHRVVSVRKSVMCKSVIHPEEEHQAASSAPPWGWAAKTDYG